MVFVFVCIYTRVNAVNDFILCKYIPAMHQTYIVRQHNIYIPRYRSDLAERLKLDSYRYAFISYACFILQERVSSDVFTVSNS